jgi:hypothetical protein
MSGSQANLPTFWSITAGEMRWLCKAMYYVAPAHVVMGVVRTCEAAVHTELSDEMLVYHLRDAHLACEAMREIEKADAKASGS